MSVKMSIDRTVTALEKEKTKVIKLYEFMRGLSVKNKACFDIQLKSDKSFAPIFRYGFSYNKEWKIMPIILGALCVLALVISASSVFRKD